jgi:hypothetical protein
MNIYFLVEGKTEKKVYPQWLSYLAPGLKRVKHFNEVDNGSYFIFSSGGYPSILDDIPNAVEEINECGKYTFFVVCLDADEVTVEERKNEIKQLFLQNSPDLKAQLVIVVQNRCFETWFLGNRKVYSRNPQDETFKQYCKFYNVSEKDPELMPQFPGFDSIAQFHVDYLKRMLKEKGIRYTKRFPGNVGESPYVEALKKRIEDRPTDLKSLKEFFSFCEKIRG